MTGLVFLFMRKLFLLSFLSIFISVSNANAEIYPFVGVTTAENVHVRSGQSENFESLGMLTEDQNILIIEKQYSWYKVQLPPNFHLYLSEKFVLVHSNGTGEILGDRINVRARPTLTATVMGQVSKEDTVKVEEVEDGWCAIQPLPNTYGWISEEYIKFVSKDVSGFDVKPIMTAAELKAIEEQKIKEEELRRKAELLAKQKEEERRKITFKGYLKSVRPEYDGVGTYKVITSNNLTYILDEDSHIFDNFVDLMVTIDAKITSFADNRAPYPIIKVDKIQLVL